MSSLSSRGHKASVGSKDTVIWDVLHNLWDPETNPSGHVSLGVAENALMHEELAEYVKKIDDLPTKAFTYGDGPTGSKRLKLALSKFLTKGLKTATPITPDHLVITSGVTAAIEHCSWAFCNSGDGMLLGMPHYGAFVPDIETRPGTKVVKVTFGDIDPIGEGCVSRYEDAVLQAEKEGIKVRALMLCNPHNPLGRCYSRATLILLTQLCAKHTIHLISDEIYAFTLWQNTTIPTTPEPFTSILSLTTQTDSSINTSLTHCLWGLSKDFGANGLRLGVLVSQYNPAFLAALRTVGLHSAPSALADHVAATLLEDDVFTAAYVATNQRRLGDENAFVVEWARRYGIPYAAGANAAFFLWCNLGAVWKTGEGRARQVTAEEVGEGGVTLTAEIMAALMEEKIFLASGETFGSEREGWFRIVFSQPREYLEEGLRRVVKALGLDELGESEKKG